MSINVNIELLKREDEKELLILWRKQGDVLGIPFKSGLYKLIDAKQFYCIKENNKIIAFCAYKIMKRQPEVRLCHLCVDENYRNLGIAKFLIQNILKSIPSDLDFVAHAKDGAENNSFYDKYKLCDYEIEHKKTMDIRIYKLDKIKLKGDVKNRI
jgi:ribosomal protein S18 acetylase RimI-like enzyme